MDGTVRNIGRGDAPRGAWFRAGLALAALAVALVAGCATTGRPIADCPRSYAVTERSSPRCGAVIQPWNLDFVVVGAAPAERK